jgi:hypothetical protein
MHVMRRWCAAVVTVALAVSLSSCSGGAVGGRAAGDGTGDAKISRDAKANTASALLNMYCELEQKQQYTQIYDMLSEGRKKYLQRLPGSPLKVSDPRHS